MRSKTVKVKYRLPNQGAVFHFVIYATGLNVYDKYEWKTRKYGKETGCIWRKLHLAVDISIYKVIAAEVNLASVGDTEVLPIFLNLL